MPQMTSGPATHDARLVSAASARRWLGIVPDGTIVPPLGALSQVELAPHGATGSSGAAVPLSGAGLSPAGEGANLRH